MQKSITFLTFKGRKKGKNENKSSLLKEADLILCW